MKITFLLIPVLIVALFSCGSDRTVEAVETGDARSLTFEDTVRFHIEKYCRCYSEFNSFILEIKDRSPDSVDMEKYNRLRGEATLCFDPDGAIKAFGKNLNPERTKLKNELFHKFRNEMCPEIIPGKR